jgi:hypothetical protein
VGPSLLVLLLLLLAVNLPFLCQTLTPLLPAAAIPSLDPFGCNQALLPAPELTPAPA